MLSKLTSVAINSCVAASIARCNLRQVRRFSLPCLRIFHLPSPYTFSPVASTTMMFSAAPEVNFLLARLSQKG
jgi:hypothetical protein